MPRRKFTQEQLLDVVATCEPEILKLARGVKGMKYSQTLKTLANRQADLADLERSRDHAAAEGDSARYESLLKKVRVKKQKVIESEDKLKEMDGILKSDDWGK